MIAYESALKGDLRLRVEAVSRRTFRVRIADVEASEPGMNRYGFILPQPEPDANAREVRVNGQAAEYSLRQDGWCARIEGGFVSIPVEETGEEICLEVR